MKNKKGLEASFAWIFALIVGAVILFIAIYAVVKLVGMEREVQSAEAAKQLGIILIPAETSFESMQAVPPIVFPSETRIYNNCTDKKNFGEQMISLSASSGIGEKWSKPGVPSTFYNKYIFSTSMMQGDKFYVFSKPFSRPFKIADIIFMWAGDYCFVNPPNEIRNEMEILGNRGINITDSIAQCKKKSKKICFNSQVADCDIAIDTLRQTAVWKEGHSAYYEGSLVYGAVFSSPEVYDCQVQRLMKRASELSSIYLEKSKNVAVKSGCSSNLQANLLDYSAKTAETNNSFMLVGSYNTAEELKKMNEEMINCKLW